MQKYKYRGNLNRFHPCKFWNVPINLKSTFLDRINSWFFYNSVINSCNFSCFLFFFFWNAIFISIFILIFIFAKGKTQRDEWTLYVLNLIIIIISLSRILRTHRYPTHLKKEKSLNNVRYYTYSEEKNVYFKFLFYSFVMLKNAE